MTVAVGTPPPMHSLLRRSNKSQVDMMRSPHPATPGFKGDRTLPMTPARGAGDKKEGQDKVRETSSQVCSH